MRATLKLPNPLHPDQIAAYDVVIDARALPDSKDPQREEWGKNSGGRFKAIRCGRRWGKCLARGSRVAMADGTYREVQDVGPGEMVWTVNEATGQLEARPVQAVMPNGRRETVIVRTEARELRCTPNHPLLVEGEWIDASLIKPGALLAVLGDGGLVRQEVISVAPAGEAETWDLSLAGNHNFFAEGVCTHNTEYDKTEAVEAVARGEKIAWCAPDYKKLSEAYEELLEVLWPIKRRASKQQWVIRCKGGGRIDFWSLENDQACRSRHYHGVIIDEAAFAKKNMMAIWTQSIKPSLLDYQGWCIVTSNTHGIAADNFMFQICNQPEHGFIEYHAPSWNNPHVPKRLKGESDEDHMARRLAVFDELRVKEHPLVFQQEYGAEFVDWSGVAFFDKGKLLFQGEGVPAPARCDYVFATIDSATKTGSKNDGTAVCYWARMKYSGKAETSHPPLVLLDWDIVQIEGDILVNWLDKVFLQLEQLAQQVGARHGSQGAHIEDKASGMILNLAAQRAGKPAHAIPSILTSVGKDERAISVSGYVYRGEVKLSAHAYDKLTVYKNKRGNHLIDEVCGFRIGVPDQADDLLDAFVYGVAIALGDQQGI